MANAWSRNHPWAVVYDFMVERSAIGKVLWRVGLNSDIDELYRAADEIGTLPDDAAVLDIPCGGGVALRGVRAGQKLRYVAADISTDMLARTRDEAAKRGLAIELAEEDAAGLSFGDATFDLVVCFTSLHCFPDPAGSVKEFGRVLKPGAAISGSAMLTDVSLIYKPVFVAGKLGGLLGPGGTTDDLRRWLTDAGFEDLRIRRSGGMTYFHGRRA
ncbi:MAG: hypothetical protein QOF76_1390 [Solirubrobacteraceae bacterium]|jgi:SAM-dependent methyltransferase|nr:hypothetical protein [Solirubrobacteraceae bacterium]